MKRLVGNPNRNYFWVCKKLIIGSTSNIKAIFCQTIIKADFILGMPKIGIACEISGNSGEGVLATAFFEHHNIYVNDPACKIYTPTNSYSGLPKKIGCS